MKPLHRLNSLIFSLWLLVSIGSIAAALRHLPFLQQLQGFTNFFSCTRWLVLFQPFLCLNAAGPSQSSSCHQNKSWAAGGKGFICPTAFIVQIFLIFLLCTRIF